jgi:hypothetical protein
MISFVRMIAMSAVLAASVLGADATGKWVGKVETPNGSRDVTFHLKQDGEKLTGHTLGRDGAEIKLDDGSVKGDDLAFSVTRKFNDMEFKIDYKGKLADKELKLKFAMFDQDRELVLKRE